MIVVGEGLGYLVAKLRAGDVVASVVPTLDETILAIDAPLCILVAIASDADLDLCKEIRDRAPPAVAVIAVVSDDLDSLAVACLGAGADDVVSQATPGPLLVARVRAHLRRQAAEGRDRQRQLMAALGELERKEERIATLNGDLAALGHAVAHDLRAPVRAIDGFARALEEDQGHLLDDPGREHLGRVHAAATRLSALIDDVDMLARTMTAPLTSGRVDLTELARIVARAITKRDPDRRAVIDVEEGLFAVGDQSLLLVVLEKLIGNAWKFTAEKPSARIAVGSCPGEPGAFFVRDDGDGFDMAYVGKLFRPFQRLHDRSEGRGCGLAVVRWIIGRHGGRVWAESTPAGASFFFTLGVRAAPP